MLCWHLFYCANPEGVEFNSFTRWIGMLGDVCVSLFLFLSGYGLSVSYEKSDKTIGKFIICRFLKFYSNYWFMLLLLLPIGVFVFNKHIADSQEITDYIKSLTRTIFAISGHQSYNPSWWFNTLIIQLYLLFPLLYCGIKYACLPTIIITCFLSGGLMKISKGVSLTGYIVIFVVAMVFAIHNKYLFQYLNKITKRIWQMLVVLILIVSIIWLTYLDDGQSIFYKGLYVYMFLTLGLVLSTILFAIPSCVRKVFQFLGRHSLNIYLMHTLIFYFFFPEFFYSFEHPFVIFIVLLSVCLVLSVTIETIKTYIHYNTLFAKICAKIK